MKNKFLKSNKGSFTVEASLIFLVVFISAVALIYTGQLVYKQVLLQALASDTAERGAAIWNDSDRDMFVMQVRPDKMHVGELYGNIFNTGAKITENEKKLNTYINLSNYDMTALLGNEITVCRPEVNSAFIYDSLYVRLLLPIRLPAGNLMNMFGFRDEIVMEASSKARIYSNAEFIRNTDLIVETVGLSDLSESRFAEYAPEVLKKLRENAGVLLNVFKKEQ